MKPELPRPHAVSERRRHSGTPPRRCDDVVVWRALAERVAEHLRRGRLVGVEGRLQVRRYETAAGKRRKAAEVVADRVRFLDRKPADAGTDAVLPADDEALSEEAEADVPF